jgi:hypothetical protein
VQLLHAVQEAYFMKDKSKFIYRIAALLFTGAITAASLVGCAYGARPVSRQTIQEKKSQSKQSLAKNLQTSNSQTEYKTTLSK